MTVFDSTAYTYTHTHTQSHTHTHTNRCWSACVFCSRCRGLSTGSSGCCCGMSLFQDQDIIRKCLCNGWVGVGCSAFPSIFSTKATMVTFHCLVLSLGVCEHRYYAVITTLDVDTQSDQTLMRAANTVIHSSSTA